MKKGFPRKARMKKNSGNWSSLRNLMDDLGDRSFTVLKRLEGKCGGTCVAVEFPLDLEDKYAGDLVGINGIKERTIEYID